MDRDIWVKDEKAATHLHDAMFKAYGCADCEFLGQNGCGYCAVGNIEFGQDEGDTYWGFALNTGARCIKELTSTDYPVPEFARYIMTAKMLMPRDCNPDVYGDIVRSAAAAFVADKGSDRR